MAKAMEKLGRGLAKMASDTNPIKATGASQPMSWTHWRRAGGSLSN